MIKIVKNGNCESFFHGTAFYDNHRETIYKVYFCGILIFTREILFDAAFKEENKQVGFK
jgi:hypothetical protein